MFKAAQMPAYEFSYEQKTTAPFPINYSAFPFVSNINVYKSPSHLIRIGS